MHFKILIGILCWPVVLMGQTHFLPAITLFPVRSGHETFYPHPPQPSASSMRLSSDSVVYRTVRVATGATQFEREALSLTLEESLQRLYHTSPALRMADQWVGMARAERKRLRSFWYPTLLATGAYVRLSQPVEVRQSMKPFADSARDWLHQLFPGASSASGSVASGSAVPGSVASGSAVPFPVASGSAVSGSAACFFPSGVSGLSSWLAPAVSSWLDGLGAQTLSFPLLSSQLTGVQAQLLWPVFTGGRRIYAARIGRRLVQGAGVHRSATEASLQVRLVESYFGLRLARRVAQVRRQAWEGMERHYRQAQRMEQEGFMNKADRLFAQVARDEARREWESAVHQEEVALQSLQVLLAFDADVPLEPVSPLFLNADFPSAAYFKQLAASANYQATQLSLQESMAQDRVKMGRSDYLPTVALFGNQSLYTHHLPRNLLPRTLVGVGFTWNLFDGFRREGKVRRARCLSQSLHEGRAQWLDDLDIGIDRLYALMQHAQDDVAALQSTVQLSRELLRIRRKSFQEGMATSSDVVDAETLLAKVQVAYLAAYYEYDVSLAALLSLCGIPETFWSYVRTGQTDDMLFSDERVAD